MSKAIHAPLVQEAIDMFESKAALVRALNDARDEGAPEIEAGRIWKWLHQHRVGIDEAVLFDRATGGKVSVTRFYSPVTLRRAARVPSAAA